MEGTMKCSANHTPLSPISFLERSAVVYRDRLSVVYENVKYTWRDTFQRCLRLASSLTQLGLLPGDVVAVLAPNVPQMYELHFGVPMAGAVLCTLNIRHNSLMISTLLAHSEPKIMFIDSQSLEIARGAYSLLFQKGLKLPISVLISDSDSPCEFTESDYFPSACFKYYNLISMGRDDFTILRPEEHHPIALNYTSGTTSNPKGVVYSHRGAYLNSLASVILSEMGSMPVYLWTVPMFHCNGWCFTWGVAAQGGTNICLRNITAQKLFQNISCHKVTHMSAAPTVLNMIVNSPPCHRTTPLHGKVSVLTGGAPPPPTVIFQMQALGFHLIHSYGLTETLGPATICTWNPEWDSLPPSVQAKIKSRQGVHHLGLEVDVKDSCSMQSVQSDGKTLGEVMFRGNTVMSGYWRDMKATEEAFSGGWFHSGDLGVKHADGYVELKDRAKDIIISGGENISTIEVESVLFAHPGVLEAAVVGRPDDHWGETPCAFVKLKDGFDVGADEIILFCHERLPHYMAPKTVVFQELPKTSTGKIQKFVLKEKAKSMGSLPKKNPSRM